MSRSHVVSIARDNPGMLTVKVNSRDLDAVEIGHAPFLLVPDDWTYMTGDIVMLREWDFGRQTFTDRPGVQRMVTCTFKDPERLKRGVQVIGLELTGVTVAGRTSRKK